MIATGRRLAAALLLALVAAASMTLVTAPLRARAQQPAAPGPQYVAALRDALDALPPADTTTSGDPALARVRAPLQLARDLSPNPAAVAPVVADLDRNPVDLRDARQDLQTLIAAADFPQGSVAEDPHAAQKTLHDVYSQSQFSGLGTRQHGDDLLTRIGRAVVDFFRWLANHTVGALGTVPTLILAGLVIAAIVGFVLWRLQRSGSSQVGRRVAEEKAPRGVDVDDEWRLATDAAARGDHREAVRHAFRSALLAVAETGRLHVDAAWTTSELLTRARADADLVAALAPAADCFDRAWYSGRPVTEADWTTARERCGAVRQLASTRRRGAAAGSRP